jgi:tetratricopeptide (TPR) repeat protein
MFTECSLQDYCEAERCLRHALKLISGPLTEAWEATVVNLGHTLRKQQKFEDAVEWYTQALALNPRGSSTHGALGYTYHLEGKCHRSTRQFSSVQFNLLKKIPFGSDCTRLTDDLIVVLIVR